MQKPLNFQSIMLSLQDFWARQGCLIWQPYYTQVGAGTMNPATALRVLGPEQWNVAYVEPSIRPDDGRYGENPNRMQMHYQFQVILKPDPGNPQEMYLKSLEALGIDPRQHDIRFVEDNWESPALGAWGLGWEVWLDGQEITQYTYFQQGGGILLDPVSVEITYGLERIAIALQRVNSFCEIQWSTTLTDGDVNLQGEQEHSKYYFETADVQRLRQMFDLFESEADACLSQRLVLPAHDYVLKCSHTFNVLDARGAIGVTERQAFFSRMRDLSRRVAEAYVLYRQGLGFPWLNKSKELETESRAPVMSQSLSKLKARSADFLLEIGTEELPVGDLNRALDQLRSHVSTLLVELRMEHGEIRVQGTPRRLVVFIEKVTAQQPDMEQVIKGPPAERAFGPDGVATQAAQGFARSTGTSVQDLQIREIEKGRYVVALITQKGRPAPEILAEALPNLIASIRFDKSMRWNSSNVNFSRPIRWLLALYGDQILPFEYAGLNSGNTTRGLRIRQPAEYTISTPAKYFHVIDKQGIVLDVDERQRLIQNQISTLAIEVHGTIVPDPDLLDEVTNLVEAPSALRGEFDPTHLQLPSEVLVSVMKKHQRYFPVYALAPHGEAEDVGSNLLPYFIFVTNKPANPPGEGAEACGGSSMIIEGNQHVIRARFADADYFVREDKKHSLESFLPRLKTLTFQVKVGSMLDKAQRITRLVDDFAPPLCLDKQDTIVARRAAELCKADLASSMVVEMTSLQGVMGRYYALNSGESQAVGDAIFEHYLPRYSGDATPKTRPGLVVGIVDRLDTLGGLFAAGLAPTGSKDPFAQRRAALGLVQNLITWNLDFSLRSALQIVAHRLPVPASPESQTACLEFIIERLRNLFLEQGERFDVVEAVLAVQGENPAHAARAVRALTAWVNRPDWNTILPAYARCVRITRDIGERFEINPAGFSEPAEKDLFTALLKAEVISRQPGSVDDFLGAFLPMIPTINRFFDEVLVMTEEASIRQNRLGLLQRIASLAEGVADLARLEGF